MGNIDMSIRDKLPNQPNMRQRCYLFSLLLADLISPVLSFARSTSYDYQDEPQQNFIYQMITGGFGAFMIVFMGLGGVATIMMTREGNTSHKTPVLGIVMVVIAIAVFVYRLMINSGMMGHEHMTF